MFSRQGVCSGCKEYTGISIHPEGFGQGYSSGTAATSNTDWACQGDERNVGCIQIVETEPSTFFFAFRGKSLVLNCHDGCCDCKKTWYFNAFREALGKGDPVPQGRIERQSGVPRRRGPRRLYSDNRQGATGFFSLLSRHDSFVTSCHDDCCCCKEFIIMEIQPQAFGKGIPVPQARVHAQSGHAKETTGTLALLR